MTCRSSAGGYWSPSAFITSIPEDFARRSFVDTNGEVAAIALFVLASLLLIPLNHTWGAVGSLFGLTFCGVGMLTNQIHQWAHLDSVPTPVRWLQRARTAARA